MQLIQIQSRRTRASIAPRAGGRLHQLEIRDRAGWLPLLLAPTDLDRLISQPLAWGSYPMVPWPGRIDGARFLWQGRQYEVPANPGPHSLHGRGVYSAWTVDGVTATSCRLSLQFDEGWPFAGRATQIISVEDRAIVQRLEVHALGTRFPAGAGWHPWFRRDVRPGRDPRLRIDAERIYEAVDDIPTGWTPKVRGDNDLRAYPALGNRRLDSCYRHPRGPLAIGWGDIELTMESSPNVAHAVVYTPSHAFCVEPQTCAPDAFNLGAQGIEGAGMTIVTPRRPLIAATTWRWRIGARGSENDGPRR